MSLPEGGSRSRRWLRGSGGPEQAAVPAGERPGAAAAPAGAGRLGSVGKCGASVWGPGRGSRGAALFLGAAAVTIRLLLASGGLMRCLRSAPLLEASRRRRKKTSGFG